MGFIKCDGMCEECGMICDCPRSLAEVLFEWGCVELNPEHYGYHLWGEDSPWQANAIKILEEIR